ncbi:Uncharacterized protein PBTT_01888 [Plasmodiophora brassicae]
MPSDAGNVTYPGSDSGASRTTHASASSSDHSRDSVTWSHQVIPKDGGGAESYSTSSSDVSADASDSSSSSDDGFLSRVPGPLTIAPRPNATEILSALSSSDRKRLTDLLGQAKACKSNLDRLKEADRADSDEFAQMQTLFANLKRDIKAISGSDDIDALSLHATSAGPVAPPLASPGNGTDLPAGLVRSIYADGASSPELKAVLKKFSRMSPSQDSTEAPRFLDGLAGLTNEQQDQAMEIRQSFRQAAFMVLAMERTGQAGSHPYVDALAAALDHVARLRTVLSKQVPDWNADTLQVNACKFFLLSAIAPMLVL